jgi:poly(A) polymerase
VDYANGVADLQAKQLVMIGDPEQRYREDPVRMLRAARLAAKLGLEIEENTRAPIASLASLLQNVPAARLFDEMLKLLFSGHAWECLSQLRQQGLHHGFFPLLDVIMEQPLGEKFVMLALRNTDERLAQEKPVSPAFLFAALLWHEVLADWKQFQTAGERPVPALHAAMDAVLARQKSRLAIPHRHDAVMKEIWLLQLRFEQRAGQRPFRLLEQPRFRAAYDFLLLRCASGEVADELGLWWDEFQQTNADRRAEMLLPEGSDERKRRRRRPRRKPVATGAEA